MESRMGTGEETKRGVCVFPQKIILENRTELESPSRVSVQFQSLASRFYVSLSVNEWQWQQLPGPTAFFHPSPEREEQETRAGRWLTVKGYLAPWWRHHSRAKYTEIRRRLPHCGAFLMTCLLGAPERDGGQIRADATRKGWESTNRDPLAMPQLRPGLCSSSAACSCIRNCPRIFVCISMSRGGGLLPSRLSRPPFTSMRRLNFSPSTGGTTT